MSEDRLLGRRISFLRASQNITQEQLAEMIGVTTNVLSNWENGRTKLDAEYLKPISNALNVSVADILNYDKPFDQYVELKLIDYKSPWFKEQLRKVDPDGIIDKYYSLKDRDKKLINIIMDFNLGKFNNTETEEIKKPYEPELIAAHGTEGMDDDELELVRQDVERLKKNRK